MFYGMLVLYIGIFVNQEVVGFTSTCAISNYRCEFEPHLWRGIQDITIRDKVCQ